MTEKRYELIPMDDHKTGDIWYGLFDNKKLEYTAERLWLGSENICDELNTLNDENVELKEQVDRMVRLFNMERGTSDKTIKGLQRDVKTLQFLEEENKEFKHLLKEILLETERSISYSDTICQVKVQVSPKMYDTLTKILRSNMGG